MSQARYFERRANDPTPEQIRIMCELIRSRWAVTGDKRLIPHPEPVKQEHISCTRSGGFQPPEWGTAIPGHGG